MFLKESQVTLLKLLQLLIVNNYKNGWENFREIVGFGIMALNELLLSNVIDLLVNGISQIFFG